MATARAQLRTNLLHCFSAYRDTIDDLDNRITLATKSGTTELVADILDRDTAAMAKVLVENGFKASELDFHFSLVPPASTTIPLGVGSVTREPAGAEYRPVEIFGIVLGAVGLAGVVARLYTMAKHFDARRILP